MMIDVGLAEVTVVCPYCGVEFTSSVDFSGGTQDYYEDCQVCCQAILFSIDEDIAGADFTVTVKRDDE